MSTPGGGAEASSKLAWLRRRRALERRAAARWAAKLRDQSVLSEEKALDSPATLTSPLPPTTQQEGRSSPATATPRGPSVSRSGGGRLGAQRCASSYRDWTSRRRWRSRGCWTSWEEAVPWEEAVLGGGGAAGAAAQLVSCLYATDVTHGSLDLSMAQERAQYGPTEADGGWDGHDCAGGLSKGEPGCGEACADGSRARRRRRNTRLSVVLVPDDTE